MKKTSKLLSLIINNKSWIILILLIMVASVVSKGLFFTADNLISVLKQNSYLGLNVVLGLNYREALQIGDIVLGRVLSQNETIEKLTRDLGEMLNLNCLLVHRHKEAACFTNNTYYEMSVPYCNTPKLTTGAGDNFNSGFVYAYANQMMPDECLKCAIGTSGYYVRNGHSPTINELVSFFVEWDSGELA